jgi:hypothetical protein
LKSPADASGRRLRREHRRVTPFIMKEAAMQHNKMKPALNSVFYSDIDCRECVEMRVSVR